MCPENSGRPVGVGKVTRFGKRKIQPASFVNNAMTKRPARRPNPHSGRPVEKKQHPFGMGSFVARANCLFVTRIFRRTTRWGRQNRGGSLWNKTKQGCGPVCEGAVRRGTARWGNVAGRRGRSGMWNEPPEFFGARAARMGKIKTLARISSGSGQVPFCRCYRCLLMLINKKAPSRVLLCGYFRTRANRLFGGKGRCFLACGFPDANTGFQGKRLVVLIRRLKVIFHQLRI